MKRTMPVFEQTLVQYGLQLTRKPIEILQINVGKLCNQACHHCHVEAGPKRIEVMEKKTVDRIIALMDQTSTIHTVDITGGAPELNPHFRYLVHEAKKRTKKVIDRCNLTVLFEKEQDDTARFLRDHQVNIIASLSCYSKDNVDEQRGNGVFDKSIRALKLLNGLGYGQDHSGLQLDLVHNPLEPVLPSPQEKLESDYKKELKELFGIEFDHLYTITNMPIKRFSDLLRNTGKLEEYTELLVNHFNPQAALGVMCRNLVSIGWDGQIYDCDFNQMLEIPLGGKKRTIWDIQSFDELATGGIAFADHCYGCTAGAGSSCGGVMKTIETVKQYYGKTLKTNGDLKTNACCTTNDTPSHLKKIIDQIHPEVLEKFYGCGSPIPAILDGKTVLDLGCGTGRDAFVLSKLVGPEGKVVGIDMTAEQLDVAQKYVDHHRQLFGYSKSNVNFHLGVIEDLEKLGIKTGSIDVVVSNCVINLSPEKRRVFSEIFRVLKPGGELYFADVFSGRRVPKNIAEDPVMVGECLGGALYIEDFRRLLAEIGFPDYRIVTQRRITLNNPSMEQRVGTIPFYSMTVRAFKLKFEDRCEDYGQVAYYLGTIPQCPHAFPLDDHHLFENGRPMLVCSNTAAMLTQTRYAPHFRVEGDLSTHYGLFDCVSKGSAVSDEGSSNRGCC